MTPEPEREAAPRAAPGSAVPRDHRGGPGRGLPRLAGIVLAGLVLLLGACTHTPLGDPMSSESGMRSAGNPPLSGAEVRAALGKPQRYRWTTAAGASGYTQVAPNGRLRTYWDTDAVNGRIRFTDEGYCTRYDGVRNSQEDCYRVYRITARQLRIFRADGTYSGLIELEH